VNFGKKFLMIFIFSILVPIFCFADTTLGDFLEQLKTSIQEKGGSEAEFKIGFITSAIELLKKSESQFKDGVISYNPDVRFKFMRMVEEFEDLDVDEVLPHDLRRISARIIKFDNFLNRYCTARDRYLSAQDKAFFTQLRSLCQMLVICLDDETDFDISLMDTFCDYGFHRPVEWIKKHPYISTGIAAALVASAVYFTCFYDSKKGIFSGFRIPLTHEYKANGNGFEVIQPAQLHQVKALSCGYHALWHFCCRATADLKKQSDDDMLKVLNDRKAFDVFYDECRRIEGYLPLSESESEIDDSKCGKILREHSAFRDFKNKDELVDLLIVLNQSNIFEAQPSDDPRCKAKPLCEDFRLRIGAQRSYFMVNLGEQNAPPLKESDITAKNSILSKSDGRMAHWIYYDFDLTDPSRVKIWAGDSMGGNRTKAKVLSDIWTKVVQPVADDKARDAALPGSPY